MVRTEYESAFTDSATIVPSKVRELTETARDIVGELVHFFRINLNAESMGNDAIGVEPLEFAGEFSGHTLIIS